MRLEVTGTSCSGEVRWFVGTVNSGGDQNVVFPWSLSLTGQSGQAVELRACNTCTEEDRVTITTSIYWNGALIATDSRTGDTREDHCQPNRTVTATLP